MFDAVVSWYAPSDLYDLAADRAADDVPDDMSHQHSGHHHRPVNGENEGDRPPRHHTEKGENNAAHSHEPPEDILLGVDVKTHKAAADAASPEVYIANMPQGKALPDFLLMKGTMDPVISPLQTKRLYQTLKKQGGAKTVDLIWVKDGSHGGKLFTPHVADVVKFLKQEFAKHSDS